MNTFASIQLISILVLACFLVGGGSAAGPDAYLQETLSLAGEEEMISVIVAMKDRVDLQREVDSCKSMTRAIRHERIVRSLQRKAEGAQKPLLEVLANEKGAGRVGKVRSLWIANLVLLSATPDVIEMAASRDDVETVYFDYRISLIDPVERDISGPGTAGTEDGIEDINVPYLWKEGFTGGGILMSHLDTGCDGEHEALGARWRGHDEGVDPSEAFFDPVTGRTFPFDSGSHGTHTMGTMCGRAGTDTIGVAFDAKWITAAVIDRVSIDRTISDALLAFQWTADPDGNPGTMDDVPVVSSNSWGISPIYHGYPKCDDTFWAVIDGCEAAGVSVVFAAGNEGSGSETLRTPADRIETATNVFSIGALNAGSQSIASFSSRGPSGCDHATIKPEVCTRGVDVRSAMPGNAYGTMSGTSMACPHAAGAIALVRQINPDLTSHQAKSLLNQTAADLGAAGEDNTYGHGRIDLRAAGDYLMENFGTLQGEVKDAATGEAVESRIHVIETGQMLGTGAAGQYRMKIAPGSHQVSASAFGYRTLTQDVTVAENETVTLNFLLEEAETGTIEGRVMDLSHYPIAGAQVEILDTPLEPKYTNAQGNYRFANVPGGATYNMKASASGYYSDSENGIYLAEGGWVTIVFELEEEEEECLVRGTLEDDFQDCMQSFYLFRDVVLQGTPRGDTYVRMFYRHSLPVLLGLRTDGDLRNRIRDLFLAVAPDLSYLAALKSGEETDSARILLSGERMKSIEEILGRLERSDHAAFSSLAEWLRKELSAFEGRTAGEILQLFQTS